MFRKSLIAAAVCLMPAMAMAQGARGPFELSLAATGSNGVNFNGVSVGGTGRLGYFLTDNIEVFGVETAAYGDQGTPAHMSFDTALGAELNFPLGDQSQFVPFVGASAGYLAATGRDHPKDQWTAGPEAGLKYFVNNSTFIYGRVTYEVFFDQGGHDPLRNGQFLYDVGIGFRF